MPQLICVHGAERADTASPRELARRWTPPLLEGLARCGHDVDFSLQCAWYADLLREQREDGSGIDLGLDPVQLFGESAREWLDSLLNSGAGSALGDTVVAWFFEQLWRYLEQPLTRAECRRRLARTLAADTRVVIAHSLGSLVAWEVLMRERHAVHTLITVGSPLLMPGVIAPKLQPPPGAAGLARPPLQRWLNVAHRNDWVAHPADFAPRVDGAVEDAAIEGGERPHAIETYLQSAPVARAVADALRAAPAP